MVTDIVLKDNEVHVNGWRLVVNGADLIVDAGPDRRGQNPGIRRAIVHGFNDTLVINYSNDYPNGVVVQSGMTVNGVVKGKSLTVNGVVKGKSLEATDTVNVANKVVARSANNQLQLGEDGDQNTIDVRGKGMQIRGGIHVMEQAYFNLPVHTPDITIAPAPGADPVMTYSLLQHIAQLEARIQALENA